MRRLPAAARWCALVAFANALVWSIVTPPFHVPDETGHIVYVQHLAETGDIPDDPDLEPFSAELVTVLDSLRFNSIVGRPRDRAVFSEAYDRSVQDAVRDPANPVGLDGDIESSGQPPLYYAAQAGVYLASPWQDLLHRLYLMRILSALLAAATTVFVFLFLREVLAPPWAATVGALAVAFQPLLGFMSGGVTPDTLLFTASAALFYGLARGFRHGLSLQTGLVIGAALAAGALTKLNFVALIPGALLGLALLLWRAPDRRTAAKGAAAAVTVLVVAVGVYAALNLALWDRTAWGGGVETAVTAATSGESVQGSISPGRQLSYMWQLYLPKLPFMTDELPGYPVWNVWFKGMIGVFGWLDTTFPKWVYFMALGLVFPLGPLLAVALWKRRHALRDRWAELLTYTVIVLGVLASIGVLGLRYREDTGNAFEQTRYLLPLLPLYAAGLALAIRGAGERLARPLAALVVVLAMAHGLFAQLLVISRYYG